MVSTWRIGCGGLVPPEGGGEQRMLAISPSLSDFARGNIRFGFNIVLQEMMAECPAALLDLLEIAVYVYTADQATSRGKPEDLGLNWRRKFAFRIPVRDPDRWSDPSVVQPLVGLLEFLSEDEYRFEFMLKNPDARPGYFQVKDTPFSRPVDRVLLFSGGLDSLTGAVEEAVVHGLHVLLVQHRSNPKLQPRHDALVAQLSKYARQRGGLVSHVPVIVNKAETLTESYTQRSRSLMFAALAAAVGAIVGRQEVRFYENGVVSINLPISPAVVGARASRTTHPRVICGFQRLLSAVAGKTIEVDNVYRWDTRADVIRRLAAAGCAGLLGQTISCGATRVMTARQPHCGMCTQCIDRRFAVLAAGQEANDSADGYRIDVLIGDRTDGDPRLVLAAYLETIDRVERTSNAAEFLAMFGEAARSFRSAGESPTATAERVFQLYKRHAAEVAGVLDAAAGQYARQLRHGELPEGCTLRLVFGNAPTERGPREITSKPSQSSSTLAPFPTPPGAQWSDVHLRFKDGHTLAVKVAEVTQTVTYSQLGMSDGRNAKPTKQWELLRSFASGGGTLSWGSPTADRKQQKRRETLAGNLQDYFRIEDDPVELTPDGQGWRLRFVIESE